MRKELPSKLHPLKTLRVADRGKMRHEGDARIAASVNMPLVMDSIKPRRRDR